MVGASSINKIWDQEKPYDSFKPMRKFIRYSYRKKASRFFTSTQEHSPQVQPGQYVTYSSHILFIFEKYIITYCWSWVIVVELRFGWKIQGPFLCWKRSLRSSQTACAESKNNMLKEIPFNTKFKIQVITMWLLQVQAESKAPIGWVMIPLAKQSSLRIERAKVIDRLHVM